jgi:MerR family transcriptional regulator, light-induced transcriptional regulator
VRVDPGGVAASQVLSERRQEIARQVTGLYFDARPDLEISWRGARKRCTEDNCFHLDFLSEALAFGQPALFTEYAVWAAALLARLHIPGEALVLNLQLLRTALATELEGDSRTVAFHYVDAALARLEEAEHACRVTSPNSVAPGFLEGDAMLDVLARDYLSALLAGKRHAAGELILAAADRGTSIKDIYLFVFQRVQYEIGRLWQSNQIGVAQEHYCTACTQAIMSQLYPRIFSTEKNGRRLVATCVSGDLHEIGPRMVADFFEMEGWDTFFLGANTPLEATLQQISERSPHVLAISATMPFHVHGVAELIQATRAAGRPPRILVGGAPFNAMPELWKDVGADACARDAAEALVISRGWTD